MSASVTGVTSPAARAWCSSSVKPLRLKISRSRQGQRFRVLLQRQGVEAFSSVAELVEDLRFALAPPPVDNPEP